MNPREPFLEPKTPVLVYAVEYSVTTKNVMKQFFSNTQSH